jgi:hypothetical protein
MKQQRKAWVWPHVLLFALLVLAFYPGAKNSVPAESENFIQETLHFSDIAAFYYYGGGDTRIHTWINDQAGSFHYSGAQGWFRTSRGYDGTKLFHPVCGDFDGDGMDDIASFYDYGNGAARIHVWLCENGYQFRYQGAEGWWAIPQGYDVNHIVGTVSGDFDGDGLDDIAAFYDYGNNQIRIHLWLSTGSNFLYEGSRGWWAVQGYPAKNMVGILAGEFSK